MPQSEKVLKAIGEWTKDKSPICPVMSAQMFLPIAGGLVAPNAAESMVVTIPSTPCVGMHCAMALNDAHGGFAGCGFAPGRDIIDLTLAVGALHNVMASPLAAQIDPPGSEALGAVLVAVKKQTAAVAELIRELLKRMAEKPAARPSKAGT
jgi:hypothetical protein